MCVRKFLPCLFDTTIILKLQFALKVGEIRWCWWENCKCIEVVVQFAIQPPPRIPTCSTVLLNTFYYMFLKGESEKGPSIPTTQLLKWSSKKALDFIQGSFLEYIWLHFHKYSEEKFCRKISSLQYHRTKDVILVLLKELEIAKCEMRMMVCFVILHPWIDG